MPQNASNVPSQTFYGVAIAWGIGTAAISITGASMLVQSTDNELSYDAAEVRDQRGNVVAKAFYNAHDQATLEYIATMSGTDTGTSSLTYPTAGAMITIGADAVDPISGSSWLVDSVMVRRANTDAAKIQIKATRYNGITA